MIKTLIWTAVLIIIIGGGYWYTQRSESDRAMMASSMGTYEYVCDNGSRFTMTPSDDVSEVQLTAGSQGMFTGTIRLARMGRRGSRARGGQRISHVQSRPEFGNGTVELG
jgi:hypothetical protein